MVAARIPQRPDRLLAVPALDHGHPCRLLVAACCLTVLFDSAHGAGSSEAGRLRRRSTVLLQTDLQIERESAERSLDDRPASPHVVGGSANASSGAADAEVPSQDAETLRRGMWLQEKQAEQVAGAKQDLRDLAAVLPSTAVTWMMLRPNAHVFPDLWKDREGQDESDASFHEQMAEGFHKFMDSQPMQMAKGGGKIIAVKAAIACEAMRTASVQSLEMARKGNLSGVFAAAHRALSEAKLKNELVNKLMSRSSSQGFGVLVVILTIGFIWAAESLLSQGPAKTLSFLRAGGETETTENQKVEMQLPEQEPADEDPSFLHGLTFLRYLMSWWVILDIFYMPGRENTDAWASFSRWGALAAPFFYMLSGFASSYSKIIGTSSVQNEDFIGAGLRRMATWYPFFLMGLCWCMAQKGLSDFAQDWSHFMANVFVVHRLVWAENYYPEFIGDWWLSFFVVYLFAWAPLHKALSESNDQILWTLFVLGWFATIPITLLEWTWMKRFPPFTLLEYWVSFVYGQALAVWFVNNCMQKEVRRGPTPRVLAEEVHVIRKSRDLPLLVRYGPTPILLIMCSFFFIISPHDEVPWLGVSWAPVFLRGGLLPVLAAVIVGFAARNDPISSFLSRKPFRWFGKLALMNYVFHVPLNRTIKAITGWNEELTWTYVGALLMTTIVGHYVFERPWRRLLGVYEK